MVVSSPAISGSLPFAKPNGAVLPVNNGYPQHNCNGGLINNNIPFLSGLGVSTPSVVPNNGNNLNNGGFGNFPVFSEGQLPQVSTRQQLMFGTMTVIVRHWGFYFASSEAVVVVRQWHLLPCFRVKIMQTLSFFVVHHTASSQSQLAIVDGIGKCYAKGVAVLAVA